MKKIAITCAIVLLLTGVAITLSRQNDNDITEDTIKPVGVTEVSIENVPIALHYTGTVSPQETRKVGFKNPGKIVGIYVEKGDRIKKGDLIAELDTKELLLAEKDAKENLESAKDAMAFCQSLYERVDSLFKEGAVSLQDYEKAKLDWDLQRANYNRAEVNYKNIRNSIEDATLRADTTGYAMDVLLKEGEMVGAGYPIIVMRCGGLVINVGLSEDDASKVKQGTPVIVDAGSKKISGEISSINVIPDEGTRTYNAKIILEENPFNVGALVKLQIVLGEEEGLWIPVHPIMTDGADYVYVVEGEQAVRRDIRIESVRSGRVKVEGLNAGDLLVVEGYRNLKDKDEVCID